MKRTYELEQIDSKGNVTRTKITIEEDRPVGEFKNYGDARSAFINKHSSHKDIRDYDKYSQCMPKESLDDILAAYEDLIKSLEF